MQNHGGCKSLGLPVRIMVVHEAILGEVDSRLKTTVFAAFNADRSIIILVLEVYE